jgi:hypothetical protein
VRQYTDSRLAHHSNFEEIPMQRHNHVRIMLIGSGIIAAALYGTAADENIPPPNRDAANAKARRDAARKVYDGVWQHHVQAPEDAPFNLDFYHDWSVRWMQAERDLSRTKAEDVAALEGHLKRMQGWKERIEEQVKGDRPVVPTYLASWAEFFQLEAEDWVAARNAAVK